MAKKTKKAKKRSTLKKPTSQSALAGALGKSPCTIQHWGALGCPCLAKDKRNGVYDVERVRAWAVDNGYWDRRVGAGRVGRKPMEHGPQKHTAALREHQANERQYKARILELQARKLEGELIAVAEVEEHDRKRHEYMIATLENWARALGPMLAGKTALEINAVMTRKVAELMVEFSGR